MPEFCPAPENGFAFDLVDLARRVRAGVELLVLVRPNNPTGTATPRGALEAFLRELPATTTAWIDEAYVDFLGPDQSLERFAVAHEHPQRMVIASHSEGQ